jgi:predicted CopG family antitoxin
MSRKTITVDEDAYEAAAEVKRDEESWTDCLLRLADGVEQTEPSVEVEFDEKALADDIAAQTAKKTADEVESRLTTR